MKKLTAILLSVFILFSLTSCFKREKIREPEVLFDQSQLSDTYYFKHKVVKTVTDADGNETTEEGVLIFSEDYANDLRYTYEEYESFCKTRLRTSDAVFFSDERNPVSLTKEEQNYLHEGSLTIITGEGDTSLEEIEEGEITKSFFISADVFTEAGFTQYTGISLSFHISAIDSYLEQLDDEDGCLVYKLCNDSIDINDTTYYIDKETGLVKKNVTTYEENGCTVTMVVTMEEYSFTEHCIPEFELVGGEADSADEKTDKLKDKYEE